MTGSLHISQVRLRAARGEALSAIAPLLLPRDGQNQASRSHRILWLLFQDEPDTTRDFLWREEGDGRYLVLSSRVPSDPHGLFELDTKPFAPHLATGDRLRFALRANPVMATKKALAPSNAFNGRVRGKRVDVVMHALYATPRAERADLRDSLIATTGADWLSRQGANSGFSLPAPPNVGGYAQIAVERRRGRTAGFSVLDFAGEITVTDPTAFLARLPRGFGSAKAFGNGLMLIRRA